MPESVEVPLVQYVNGERKVLGKARVAKKDDGDVYIVEAEFDDSEDALNLQHVLGEVGGEFSIGPFLVNIDPPEPDIVNPPISDPQPEDTFLDERRDD